MVVFFVFLKSGLRFLKELLLASLFKARNKI